MRRFVLILTVLIALAFISCSKDSAYEPPGPQSGTITFYNSLPYTSIVITRVDHLRGATKEFATPEYIIRGGSHKAIANLIDGGYEFPGGDDVSIDFESVARHPAQHERPLFERTVVLTVNGTQNINVKGQQGEYDIIGSQ